jgi:hypothetical protein
MVKMVQSLNASRSVSCTKASVCVSMAAVASSSSKICRRKCQLGADFRRNRYVTLLWRSKARAMQSSWRSPTEKLSPFSTTELSNCNGSKRILSFILVRSSASQMATSVYWLKGSKLYLPANNKFQMV